MVLLYLCDVKTACRFPAIWEEESPGNKEQHTT